MEDSRALGHSSGISARGSRFAFIGLGVAVLTGLALGAAGFGYRADWWRLSTAFSIFRWAAYGGAAGAALGLAGALLNRSHRHVIACGLLALTLGGMVFAIPWRWQQTVRSVPPIHDITTDLDNPPVFVAILPLRIKAPNPAEHGGPKVAAAQRRGYPDIAPLLLQLPSEQAFLYAERAAGTMGWNIVSIDRSNGLIEATDTTRFFGFKDDVVVRVQADAGGSRVDVRSVSRVGGSDVGTNAKRIRTYLGRLRQEAKP